MQDYRVFVSSSFHPEDAEFVRYVRDIIAAHNVILESGEDLGGDRLLPAIKDRIDNCQGLVALLTPRAKAADGTWTTHQWVLEELQYARDHNRRTIALVDNTVRLEGGYLEHQRIGYTPEKFIDALVRLSKTINLWRRQDAVLRLSLDAPDLVQYLGNDATNATCRFRRLGNDGRPHDWVVATLVPLVGSVFAYLPNVQEDWTVQVEVRHNGRLWTSPFLSQDVSATMKLQASPGGI